MDPKIAHTIAIQNHAGQHNRFGDPVTDHLERVAAAVPADARATALLHDLLELCPSALRQLRGKNLTRTERAALQLLTHEPGETYEAYIRRITDGSGPAGRLARTVKLADLDDHLSHPSIPSNAPPYAWARKELTVAVDRPALAAPRKRSQSRSPVKPACTR